MEKINQEKHIIQFKSEGQALPTTHFSECLISNKIIKNLKIKKILPYAFKYEKSAEQ